MGLAKRLASGLLSGLFMFAHPVVTRADDQLFSTVAKTLTDSILQKNTCEPSKPITVGVWPFDETSLPISAESAKRVFADLLAALFKTKGECFTYFDGNGVQANIDWLQRTDTFRDQGTMPLDVIQKNLQNVAFHVSGRLFEQNGEVFSVFKTVDRASGASLTTTAPLLLPDHFLAQRCGDGAVTLDIAARTFANKVKLRSSKLQKLIVEGGRFQNTNAQTEFSQYASNVVASAINEAMWDDVRRRSIEITFLQEKERDRRFRTRGLSVTPKEFDYRSEEGVPEPTTYSLNLRYWLCGNAAKTRMSVSNRDGENIEWLGSISLASVPENLSVEPPSKAPLAEDWGPDGAFSFSMTTDHGPNPSFRPGDTMEVHLQVEQDSWLYCFYIDSAGSTIQIYPNRNQDQSNPDRNFFKGGVLHRIPDPDRPGNPDFFALEFNDKTTGVEVLKCIAVSRNVTAELPWELRGNSFDPIPLAKASRLREIFQRLPNVRVSEKSVTITVSR